MVVIATKSGRLGNRLFLFAHFIAWAIEHDQRLANLTMDEYAEFFVNLRSDLFCRYPPKPSVLPSGRRARRLFYILWLFSRPGRSRLPRELGPIHAEQRLRRMPAGVLVRVSILLKPLIERLWSAAKSRNLIEFIKLNQEETLSLDDSFALLVSQNRLVLTEGWLFRNEKLLLAHHDEIRHFFRPVASVRAKVNAVISQGRRDCDVLIGIHIRRGDYRQWRSGKYYFTDDQYLDLMKRLEADLPNKRVGFLICSDERPRLEIFSDFRVTLGPGHLIEDLYSLSECDFIAAPPSTFSLWASFVGNARLYVIENSEAPVTMEDFQSYGGETSL